MKDTEQIKRCFERNARAVHLRPSIGQLTSSTRVRLRDGLECEVEQGSERLLVGMPASSGGTGKGFDPGMLGRGALGSCLAIGYAQHAALLGVPIDNIEIEVQADFDARGVYGVSQEVPPGYTHVRCMVRVESTAPEADIRRVIEAAEAQSIYMDIFRRSIPPARELKIVGPHGEVVGVDISGAMAERAAQLATARGLGQCRFERMDGESLRFADGSFDVVVCGLGLMYFPDPLASLREMARVARDGGRLAVAVWGARDRCGWASIFPIVDARVESDVCPLFFQPGTGDNLQRTAETAGWRNIRVERLAVSLPYDSDEDALAGAFAGGPVALAYSRFDERTRAAAHAEYLQSIAAFRNGHGYQIPGEFVVLSGCKPPPHAEPVAAHFQSATPSLQPEGTTP
jgi:SAM-dependent methyltransferase